MNRTQFWLAGGVVLLAVAFVGWKSSRPPLVVVSAVRLEDITTSLAVSGVLESAQRTTVSSQLNGGLVREVRVDIGKSVRAGDALVILDASEFQAQLLSAVALIQQSDSQSQLQDVLARTATSSVVLAQEALATVNDLRTAVASTRANKEVANTRVQQSLANLERVRNSSRIEQVRIADAQLTRLTSILDLNQKEANRTAFLVKEGAISQKQNEAAQSALATSIQDLRAAREEVLIAATPRPEDVQIAESQLAEARATLAGALSADELAGKVFRERLVSRQQLVLAQGELSSARANRKVSESTRLTGTAQRLSAQAAIAKTVIRAPISGKIAQRLVEPGQTVSIGSALLTIDGGQKFRIRVNIEEASIARIKLGAKATIGFDAYPELQVPAVVSEIGTSANFQLGTVEVRLTVLGRDARLKPGMTADANIFISSYSHVATVLPSALVTSGKTASVYLVEKGIVRQRDVTWAKGDGETTVVLKGLQAGDLVLTTPRSISPGSRVQISIPKSSGAN